MGEQTDIETVRRGFRHTHIRTLEGDHPSWCEGCRAAEAFERIVAGPSLAGEHFCETVEEGWRPCPASLCEASRLHSEVERLREALEEIAAYEGYGESPAPIIVRHVREVARAALAEPPVGGTSSGPYDTLSGYDLPVGGPF